jgi:predicted metal-dependent peptidase
MSKLSVFQRARSRMLIFHPFFATMLLSTPSLISRNIETACTDMVRIWYNPEFIESLSVEIAMFVMAHEIFHIILKHGLRVGSRDRELANIAMDYAINYQLKKYGFTIWPQCCYDARFAGMPWEQIYEILKKEEEKNPGRHKEGQGKPGDEGDEFDGEGNPLPRKGQGKPRKGKFKDGIGNDMSPPRAVTQDEIRKIEARIDRQVVAAFQSAQMAGNVPAGMELLVDGIIKPPLPWYDVLLAFMLQMARELEDWSRPNRRQPMMPSYRNPGMGKLGFIGDTSGSMLTDHIYAQMGMEMTTAATMTHPEQVICVWADHADCSFEQVFEPGDEIILKPRGGGGTDMRLAISYIAKYDPACVILVTDAETPWPDEEPEFPLIVLTTRDNAAIKDIPKWAHVIPIR